MGNIKKYHTIHKCKFCNSEYITKKEANKCFNDHHNKICVACHKPITLTQTHLFFDRASSFQLTCWFGSSHDMELYDLVLCDDCLDKYLKITKERPKKCQL